MGEGGGWDFKGQVREDLTVDLCQVNLTEILSAEHSQMQGIRSRVLLHSGLAPAEWLVLEFSIARKKAALNVPNTTMKMINETQGLV